MSYLSASLRFCLLLCPILSLSLASTSARAEDNLAVTFELPPPVQATPTALVRYQESLPPIATVESEDMVLQFAQNEVVMPVASSPPQGEKVGTLAEAFTLDHAAESLVATSPQTDQTWLGSGRVVTLQQRLNHSSKDNSALDAADILKADILEDWIYDGGSDSLVARTVGSAEGTRQSNGQKTMAYYGHTDPGNGVWNLGTFSYQHEAVSPEDADEKQLRRLQRQEMQLKEKAAQWNVPMSMEVRLNGLDLANQAPLAALDKGGYIERLAEAYKQGRSGEDAIAWARTQAYFDPDRQDWDAPGLGNNPHSIQRDQERRMAAIDQALRVYKAENVGQIKDLQAVKIASVGGASSWEHRPSVENPLLGQSEASDTVEFSLEPASATEQAIAPDSQIPIPPTDFLEASALETNTSASGTIEPDNSLTFEGDLVDLGKRNDRYEAAASETDTLVETAAIALDNIAAVQSEEVRNSTENAPAAQHEQSKNRIRLSRLIEGISPRESVEIESREQPIPQEALPANPQNELTLPAALDAKVKSKVVIEKTPTEAATSTEIADNPKVLIKEENSKNAQIKAFIRTEDSIVQPK